MSRAEERLGLVARDQFGRDPNRRPGLAPKRRQRRLVHADHLSSSIERVPDTTALGAQFGLERSGGTDQDDLVTRLGEPRAWRR